MNALKNNEAIRIQQENKKMQKAIDQYMQEIDHLKNINNQHEKQIESLLKFNQRLLTIIEEQVNNQSRLPQKSLQPISEVTEVDSQLMEQMMQSLQKTRNKLAAKSEKAGPYFTSKQNKHNNRMENHNIMNVYEVKDMERSQRFVKDQRQYSQFGNKSSFSKKRDKKRKKQQDLNSEDQFATASYIKNDPLPVLLVKDQKTRLGSKIIDEQQNKQNDQKYYKMSEQITTKISNDMQKFRKQSEKNHNFLDEKIEDLKNLSNSLSYNPQKKFSQLQNKLKMSPTTAALVKKAMTKKP